MRLCASCGAWIRRDRTDCPWCHSVQPPIEAAELTGAPVPPTAPRPSRRRTTALALLGVLFLLLGASGVGAYQGWQDRHTSTQREAIGYFEKGQELLLAEQYELASANFREALRLEPNFTAAAQLLQLAEQRASNVPDIVKPPSTPLPVADNERLFGDAVAALEKEEWEIAAATFDLLAQQTPDFRSAEVKEGLFRARRGAAESALEAGDLEGALRHLDQALALRPTDSALIAKRRLVSAYRTGLRAMKSENWTVAADQLRSVYLVDPEFLEVESLLAKAHSELGLAFARREIWCQAAQQYRASNEVRADRLMAEAATDADQRCTLRATTIPLRPTHTPLMEDEEDRATRFPTGTPAVVGTVEITTTATLVATVTPPVAVATWTPVAPTAAPAGGFFNSFLGESINNGCGGQYLLGTTRASDGAPIADVTVLAIDEYGNRYLGTSKVDPIGTYNIPIPGQRALYRVMVVRGDQTLSPIVTVSHDDRFVQAAEGCHIIDWQQR